MPIAPPRPKGPPLNALRAFEAAARHGSFSSAADELCVTPGAVAQHVKSLEAWAGAQLFDRNARGVELTTLGADVLPGFVSAFDSLGEAVQALRSQAAPQQIRIAALPSIAQLWLSPKLPEIRSAAKNVTISITALETPPNLKREQFDLSVFIDEIPGDPDAIEICRDVIFPVCSPTVGKQLKTPSDLANQTCLHDATWSEDWKNWMAAASPDADIDTRGPVFSLYSLAVEEAKNGAGVLIGHEPLVRQHIESGLLVSPFRKRIALKQRYAISVARPMPANSPVKKIVRTLSKN